MTRFTIDVERFVDEVNRDVERVAREVMIEMFSRVIIRSPVDTGRFRSNWFFNRREQTNSIRGAATVVGDIETGVSGTPLDQTFSLINTLPYAERLEFGYSGQAPEGMVRVTALEFGSVVEDEAS